MEMLVRTIWKALNSIFQSSSSGAELNLLLIFVLLHILLAIATLGLGGKTVCEILRPLKRIFKPGLPSLQEGVAEVTMAIPEALLYYLSLYVRAYLLLLRLLIFIYLAIIPALLAPLGFAILLGVLYGFDANLNEHPILYSLVVLSIYPSWAYWYWRIDGRRIFVNFRAAWRC